MQYTPDQLVALVEEARGHVHEVMMGAVWDKARYDRCRQFLEKTDVVEVDSTKRTLRPVERVQIRFVIAKEETGQEGVPEKSIALEPSAKAKDVANVLGKAFTQDEKIKRPRGRPRLHPTEPVPPGLSIDQEVAFMRKHGVMGSRDDLREIVKTRRHLQAG